MPTYEEVIEKMFAALPMFHRIGAAAYKADLSSQTHSAIRKTNSKASTLQAQTAKVPHPTYSPQYYRQQATKQDFSPRHT